VDYYYITIKDRIVLSSNFTGASVTNFLAAQGIPGIGGGRYFTNAVDTRTQGLDATSSYRFKFLSGDTLKLTAGFNYNQTNVTSIKPTPANVLALSGGTPIFDRQSTIRFERGTPRTKFSLAANYKFARNWGFLVREVYYGNVVNAGTTAALDQTLSAKWLTDLEINYRLNEHFSVAIGANNLFSVYPDKNNALINTSGISQYSSFSPFGFNGGFYYTRAEYKF
jgi:iron complex outermembrane receptor protein